MEIPSAKTHKHVITCSRYRDYSATACRQSTEGDTKGDTKVVKLHYLDTDGNITPLPPALPGLHQHIMFMANG